MSTFIESTHFDTFLVYCNLIQTAIKRDCLPIGIFVRKLHIRDTAHFLIFGRRESSKKFSKEKMSIMCMDGWLASSGGLAWILLDRGFLLGDKLPSSFLRIVSEFNLSSLLFIFIFFEIFNFFIVKAIYFKGTCLLA